MKNREMNRREFIRTATVLTVAALATTSYPAAALSAAEPFPLPVLPYPKNALEPVISARTMSFHYDKHTAAYYRKLNTMACEAKMSSMKLEDIIIKTAGKKEMQGIFNNAAQAWNHTFYWNGLGQPGGTMPTKVADSLKAAFGSVENFRATMIASGKKQFGSGWVWLVEKDGKLSVVRTANAMNPMVDGYKPLLTLDVWEHAYYLDYQNRRGDYLADAFDKLVNWNAVALRM